MGDPNVHQPLNVPTLVICGTKVDIRTGRHLKYPTTEKLSALQLALLEKLGARMERFGDADQALSL